MKDGEQLIPCEYDSISSWWEYGPSAHYVVKDKKVGIIDYIGKVLLPTEYDRQKKDNRAGWLLLD